MKTIVVDGRSVSPSKIVCVGRNYIKHIEELNNKVPDELVFFLKPNSAISQKLSSFHQEPLHYEGELCFLFEGNRFSAVGAKGLPWERCKGFNGSALFSHFVAIERIGPNLSLELSINGHVVQSGNIGSMLYKPEDILVHVSRIMDLEDNDIVMTGTPQGVGVINTGDEFCGKVFDNGTLIASGKWLAV